MNTEKKKKSKVSTFVEIGLLLVAVALLVYNMVQKPDYTGEVLRVLEEHPEAVVAALSEKKPELFELVKEGREILDAQARKEALEAELAEPFQPAIDEERPMRGPIDAPITIVAYSSFQCHYCADAEKTIETLMNTHEGEIRYIFKHNPGNRLSQLESYIFEAIAMQDEELAWQFHDMAFANLDAIAQDQRVLEQIIRDLGVDEKQLEQDLAKPEIGQRIQADSLEFELFGFTGTPVFLVNGVSIRGAMPIEEFEMVIQAVKEGHAPEDFPGLEGEQCLECEDEEQPEAQAGS
jgi:protein-disulfide isomerase